MGYSKEGKSNYGGYFNNELDAGKKVNQLCEESGIPLYNPGISAILTQQYKLCEHFGIPKQNPVVSGIPNEPYQKKEKTSQYKGVHWHKQIEKWYVLIYPKGKNGKYGGTFTYEIDAAVRVNQLCEELKIPLQNPGISATPIQQYQKKEKTSPYKGVHCSRYKGVYWHKQTEKWYVLIYPKGKNRKYGGTFKDELDAGKRVNQICEELRIPLQNPGINAIPNQQYQKKKRHHNIKEFTGTNKMENGMFNCGQRKGSP